MGGCCDVIGFCWYVNEARRSGTKGTLLIRCQVLVAVSTLAVVRGGNLHKLVPATQTPRRSSPDFTGERRVHQ